MPYLYNREALSSAEADRRAYAADDSEEKLVVFTLLDTGLRFAQFAGLTRENVQRQECRLVIYRRGGQHGKKARRSIVPVTDRVRTLLERAQRRRAPSSGS